MLVLTRRVNEVITIGPDIEIMIVAIRGDKIRLGINAPDDIAIHRKEVADKIGRNERVYKEIGR